MSVHGHALGQSCATYMRDSLSLTHNNCFNLGNQCVGNVRKLVGPLLGKKSRWVGSKNRVRNPVQNPVALTGASPVVQGETRQAKTLRTRHAMAWYGVNRKVFTFVSV